jgi:hypothetical protein
MQIQRNWIWYPNKIEDRNSWFSDRIVEDNKEIILFRATVLRAKDSKSVDYWVKLVDYWVKLVD